MGGEILGAGEASQSNHSLNFDGCLANEGSDLLFVLHRYFRGKKFTSCLIIVKLRVISIYSPRHASFSSTGGSRQRSCCISWTTTTAIGIREGSFFIQCIFIWVCGIPKRFVCSSLNSSQATKCYPLQHHSGAIHRMVNIFSYQIPLRVRALELRQEQYIFFLLKSVPCAVVSAPEQL